MKSILSTSLVFISLTCLAQEKKENFFNRIGEYDFIARAQIWLRYTDLNPGSEVDGEAQSDLVDLSLRRLRIGASGLFKGHWFAKLVVGDNNWNRTNNLEIDVWDAYLAYFLDERFRIGFGKTINQGLSRFAAPSTANQVGSDAFISMMPTLNRTDFFIRRNSLFLKGNLGQFEYRTAISGSILEQGRDYSPTETIDFSGNRNDFTYSGYFKYHFAETENTESDVGQGSYFGTKKVIAVGAGFMHQNEAMWRLGPNGEIQSNDLLHFAIDFFVDIPFNKGYQSFTGYLGLLNYDYGPNYIRGVGANNPVNEGQAQTFNGLGNQYPTMGTGQTLIWMSGYLFEPQLSLKSAFMPYFNCQLSNFEALDQAMFWYDFGVNYFISGTENEFTLGFQNRPIYDENTEGLLRVINRKFSVILQYSLRI